MTNRLLLMLAFLLVNCISPLSAQTTAQRQQQQQRYQQQQRQQQQYQRQQQLQARQQRLQQLQMRQEQMLRQQQQILNSRQQAAQARINANNRTNAFNRQRVVRRQQTALKLQQQNAISKQIAADRIGRSRAFAASRVGTVSSVKTVVPPAKSPLVIETKTSLKTNQLPMLRAKLLASTRTHNLSNGDSVASSSTGGKHPSTSSAQGDRKTWGPTTERGPLHDDVAKTFRSGTYTELTTDKEMVLYRVYGGKAGKIAAYWSRTKPSSQMQAKIDSALAQEWGNHASKVVSIRVPPSTKIYEGIAAPQGPLVGGGNQVYIPAVDPNWEIKEQ